MPANAVYAGNDITGTATYVGRARHAGDLIPGKLIPAKHTAYISYNGKEFCVKNYEVLVGNRFQWVKSDGYGHTPDNAVVGGQTNYDSPLHWSRYENNVICVSNMNVWLI